VKKDISKRVTFIEVHATDCIYGAGTIMKKNGSPSKSKRFIDLKERKQCTAANVEK